MTDPVLVVTDGLSRDGASDIYPRHPLHRGRGHLLETAKLEIPERPILRVAGGLTFGA
jgi:hypothetical protein